MTSGYEPDERRRHPIVEYNFYAQRLEEGCFDEPDPDRGNAGVESFYYNRVKDLPPLPEEGAHTPDEIWANFEYFLKAVAPAGFVDGRK